MCCNRMPEVDYLAVTQLFTVLEVGVPNTSIRRCCLFLVTVACTMCPHLAGETACPVLGIQLTPYVC